MLGSLLLCCRPYLQSGVMSATLPLFDPVAATQSAASAIDRRPRLRKAQPPVSLRRRPYHLPF